jgi:hypothetical protein
MSNKFKNVSNSFSNIDTVQGHCEECKEFTVLVAIIPEFYRCTGCGADTKQHINGRIRYLKLNESEIKFIKENPTPKNGQAKF